MRDAEAPVSGVSSARVTGSEAIGVGRSSQTPEITPDGSNPSWVIWSFEHGGWWRPNECGYTADLKDAGRYTLERARAIELEANRHSVIANERALRLEHAETYGPPAPPRDSAELQDTPESNLRKALQILATLPWARETVICMATDRLISASEVEGIERRITAAIAQLEEAREMRSSAASEIRTLPWCPENVRVRMVATVARGVNPGTGDQAVQLTFVCPPLVAGGEQYLDQLQAIGTELLEAIIRDRVDVLTEEAAQIRRVLVELGNAVAGIAAVNGAAKKVFGGDA